MMAASTNPENDMRFPPGGSRGDPSGRGRDNRKPVHASLRPRGSGSLYRRRTPANGGGQPGGAAGRAAEPVLGTVSAAQRRRGAWRGRSARLDSGGGKAAG